MTAFIVIATVMVVIALAWLLWPLLRTSQRATVERHVANAAIYRDQFADLDADLKRGSISEVKYAEAKGELERRLLDETRADAAPASSSRGGRAPAVVIALSVPVLAGLLYWKLGAPDAFSPIATPVESAHQLTAGQVEEMVQQLSARLQREPDNVEGWVILARTYYTMRKFPEAAAAYEKLIKLVPDEPDLLADYADALAMSQGRDLSGKPMELVQAALKADPNHWKALAMAGTAAFDRKDYKGAVAYWERLRDSQAPDSPIAKSIAASIDEARKLGGMPPAVAAASAPPEGCTDAPNGSGSEGGSSEGRGREGRWSRHRHDGWRHRQSVGCGEGQGGTNGHCLHLCPRRGGLAHAARADAGEGLGTAGEVHARRHDGDVEGHEAVLGADDRGRCSRVQVGPADAVQWRS